MSKGFKRIKEIFWFSDSEPNELLIGMCHLFVLPLAIYADFEVKNYLLAVGGMIAGSYQLYAAAWCGCLNKRLIAVQLACIIGIGTCINLQAQGLLNGSRLGWIIICIFALWNTIRVFKEKLHK
jgi:hypothetical protein